MTWSSDVAYLRGLDVMSDVVQRVPPDAWERPSPCAAWRAIDVLGHVGTGTEMGVRILRGGELSFEPPQPPGSAVVGDPVEWWSQLAQAGREATQGVDLDREVDSPMGKRTIREGLSFPAIDLFVHAWDIAAAAGLTFELADADEVADFAHSVIDPIPSEMVRSDRVFGPEREAPSAGGRWAELLAWSGRDPGWTPPA